MSAFPPLPSQTGVAHAQTSGIPSQNNNHHHASYAQTAAHNAPPPSAQPHPDKSLLYTGPSPTHPSPHPDVEGKVHVVPHDWAAHPQTDTSATRLTLEHGDDARDDDDDHDEEGDDNVNGSAKRKARKERERRAQIYQAKREIRGFWSSLHRRIVHPGPGLAGGFMTIVNLGIFAGLGYTLYTEPHTRTSPRFLGVSAVGVLTLLGVEGYATEQYLASPKTRREITTWERKAQDVVLRPGVFGALVGTLNLAVLGTLGWFAYDRWDDRSVWTRRNLSLATVGLLGWFGSQAVIVEQYAVKEYPSRKQRK